MLRALSRSDQALAAAVGVILIGALLPLRWLGWTNRLAEVLALPLTPLTHAGTNLASWLRPPAADAALPSGDLQGQLAQAADEAARFEALYHQQLHRSDELERQVLELQQMAAAPGSTSYRSLVAHLSMHGPTHQGGIAINRGARDGVTPLTIAVSRGQHVVGRVVRVDRLRSVLLPITSPETGRMRGVIRPAASAGPVGVPPSVAVHLEPTGEGAFTASVDQSQPVAVGDDVRLDDPAWSSAAQQMLIGQVEEIQVNEAQPVRRQLIIRPRYHASELAWVVLKIEEDEESDSSDEVAP